MQLEFLEQTPKWQWLLTLGLLTVWMPNLHAEGPKIYRGDSSQLPKVDFNKTFDTKIFGGSDKEVETRALETEAINLPAYSGNLNALPMTEWSSSKPDFYPQAISLRDFEIQKTLHDWSRETHDDLKTAILATESDLAARQANTPEAEVKTEEISPPPAIGGEDLKRLINQGRSETGKVRVGRGFGAVDLKPGVTAPRTVRDGSTPSSGKSSPSLMIVFPE